MRIRAKNDQSMNASMAPAPAVGLPKSSPKEGVCPWDRRTHTFFLDTVGATGLVYL